MILKGNQRGGGKQMALHLLNERDNDHVTVHEVRGFVAENVLGALNEIYALSKGTKCKQFMYSLSLSPPKDAKVGVQSFEDALERAEKKLGLEGQPRVVVFHEKEGRRHAHCVWSRINIETMTAINMDHDHNKLKTVAKSLFLDHGWSLPEGFIDKSRKSPLNFTRAEWEQAKKIGRNAADIKRDLQESWAISDNRKTFENALEERGYFLARGDRGGFVVIDLYAQIYPLNKRKIGLVKKDIAARLGAPEKLQSISEAQKNIKARIDKLFKSFGDELASSHKDQAKPLRLEKAALVQEHKDQRAKLRAYLHKRWQREELERNKNIRKGFKGLWDKINGRYWKTRKANEIETKKCRIRDRTELEELLFEQFKQRAELQMRIDELREKQERERRALIKDMTYVYKSQEQKPERIKVKEKTKKKERQNEFGFDDPDFDFEPEL